MMIEGELLEAAEFVVSSDLPDAAANWRAAAQALCIADPLLVPALATTGLPASAASLRLLVVELDESAHAMQALLSSADKWTEQAGATLILSFPTKCIDAVFAAQFENVVLLCEPTQLDRVVALSEAGAPAFGRVAEIDSITNVVRLQQLADEVARIARALARADLAEPQPASGGVSDAAFAYRPPPSATGSAVSEVKAEDIRAILRLRRQRETLLGSELFADPAWDMILDLAAARLEGVNVAISSLCIAAAVPPTTALRWIRTLTDLNIFERHADTRDGRRIFVALADPFARKVVDFLSDAKRIGALPL